MNLTERTFDAINQSYDKFCKTDQNVKRYIILPDGVKAYITDFYPENDNMFSLIGL